MAAMLSLLGAGLSAFAATACVGTPEAAAKLAGSNASSSPTPEGKGYRVTNVRWDPVMRQSWATIVSCGHPEWPGFAMRTADAQRRSTGLSAEMHEDISPMVRAGDVVELWRQEDRLRIDVTGIAEQSGSIGQTIRVRLLRRQESSQSAEEQFSGVVRGRANVEMQP